MSHVADGELHAYLDGALDLFPAEEAHRIRSHLESCGECRGRLREEERVKGEASAVLARTGPQSVDVPPFEVVRRRAAAASGRGAGSEPRDGAGTVARSVSLPLRLGWAASIAVALGVGWMVGRERAPTSQVQPAPTVSATAEPDPAETPPTVNVPSPPLGADAVASERLAAGPEGTLAQGAEDPAEEAEEAATAVASALVDSSAVEPGAASAASGLRAEAAVELQRRASRERDTVQAAAAAAPVDSAPAAVLTPPSGRVADSIRAAGVGTITGRAVRDGTGRPLAGAVVMVEGTSVAAATDEEGRYVLGSVPAGSRTLRLRLTGYEAVTETVTVRAGGTEVVDLATPVAPVALEGLVVSGVRPESIAAWRLGSRVDSITIAATTFEDGPVERGAEMARRRYAGIGAGAPRALRIPGLEVEVVEWTEVAPGVEGLRVVQRLAGDTTRVELRFGRPDDGSAPPPREDLPEGVSQVERELPGDAGWVILRGRLPPERLQRLLDLLEEG